MKNKIVFIFFIVLAACNNGRNDMQNSIEGLYVLSAQSEYSQAMDTVKIYSLNSIAKTYLIVHNVAYRKIVSGTLSAKQHKSDSAVGVYDETTAQLNEQKHGRVYSFSDGAKQLVLGSSIYKRIR